MPETQLRKTALHPFHIDLGARLVPFAGYDMPVQYADGIIAEHKHTRAEAGLFDVSHMGQMRLIGTSYEKAAAFLETLVPSDIRGLSPGRMRYTTLLNSTGGVIDDLIVTRPDDEDHLRLVVNAARKDIDHTYISHLLPKDMMLELADDLSLIALQGPKAEAILGQHIDDAHRLKFMSAATAQFDTITCQVSRCGYTGEDGFEVSVAANQVVDMARALLAHAEVKPIGLGARDTLRMEAGLPLYGQDIDEMTTPVEAGLSWIISKRRRTEGGFAGAEKILNQLSAGVERTLVGLKTRGRAPIRSGVLLFADKEGANAIGQVTSGGFGPSVGGPIAMGYVPPAHAALNAEIFADVRGRRLAVSVCEFPFIERRYKRM